ncbi:MAG: dienelactone hydrolase family protein [Myxococcaceae bacterium]|nr:dienelactone hydrolase family protein [Myxococcaceae bacterium]
MLGLAALGVVAGVASCRHRPDWGPTSRAFTREVLQAGGRQRTYALWTPPGGLAGKPLVLALHGRGGTGEGMEQLTGLSAIAAKEGFTVAAPDGVEKSWADGRGIGPAHDAQVDDVAFLAALIDALVARGADASRVSVVGMSNGAMMALTLACRIPQRLHGVVAVTGLVPRPLAQDCAQGPPLSVAFVLGTKDPLVPFAGGAVGTNRGDVLSADESFALWQRRDGCAEAPTREALEDRDGADGTTTTRLGASCPGGVRVFRYDVEGGGHTWPGGWAYLPEGLIGKTSRDFSASQAAWDFLGPAGR